MKSTLKISIAILFCLIISFFSIGCSYQRELNELNIAIGMGIDKDPTNPEYIKMIAQIVKPDAIKNDSGGDGERSKAYFNAESKGRNSFEAIRDFSHTIDNRLYQAHTVVIIMGNEIAKDGIGKHLDFFIRSIETRPLTKIVIAKGTAAETLDVEAELNKLPAMNIDNLIQTQVHDGHIIEATIQTYISALICKTESFTAPIIKIEKTGDKKILSIEGIAIFKQDKMIGKLSMDESRGLLWVKDLIKSGVVTVYIDEGNAAIEIDKASSDITVEIHNEKPIMKVKIKVDGLLATQTCKRNLETLSGFKQLERLLEKEIEKEINITLKKVQEMNADIYGFGEEVHKHYKKEWEQMENQWDKLFPMLQVDIEITAKMVSGGTIIKPIYPEEETEKN